MEDRERDSGMTFKEKLKKIIEKYGEDGQIAKALEELVELSEVLVKYLNKGELDRDHLIEEMADVDVMMAQLMIIFGIDTESYQDEIAKKIDRTMKRMEEDSKYIGDCETCKYTDKDVDEEPCKDCNHNDGSVNRYEQYMPDCQWK